MSTFRYGSATAALVVLASALAGCDAAHTPVETPADPLRSSFTNQSPVAIVKLTVLGVAGCGPGACWYDYEYNAHSSYDPDGSIVSYRWEEDGNLVSTSATRYVTALRAYDSCGGAWVQGKLIVTDNLGAADTACYNYTPVW